MFKHARGFTLIELMVTVVIIAIIVSMATLAIGDPGPEKLKEERARLLALMDLAKEEAILQSREFGILFWEDGYGFYELLGGQGSQVWQPIGNDNFLRERTLEADIRLQLWLEGVEVAMSAVKKERPQVFILSSGEMSPFRLDMNMHDDFFTTVSSDAVGNFETTEISTEYEHLK